MEAIYPATPPEVYLGSPTVCHFKGVFKGSADESRINLILKSIIQEKETVFSTLEIIYPLEAAEQALLPHISRFHLLYRRHIHATRIRAWRHS
jgi:hypothetical protein